MCLQPMVCIEHLGTITLTIFAIFTYNDLCCYKFTRNFIRHDFSRKKRAPKFTVEAVCQMKDCPSKLNIQQLANFQGYLDDQLTITFCGEIGHRQGDFQGYLDDQLTIFCGEIGHRQGDFQGYLDDQLTITFCGEIGHRQGDFQGYLDDQLTITFCGEIGHRQGDFQARRIIDAEKEEKYSTFVNCTKVFPGEKYTNDLGEISAEKFSALNRSGVWKAPSAMRNIASKANKFLFRIDQITHDVLNLQKENTLNSILQILKIKKHWFYSATCDVMRRYRYLFWTKPWLGYIISLFRKVLFILTPVALLLQISRG